MLRSVILQSPSTVIFESSSIDLARSRSPRSGGGIECNAQRSSASIPKLEPFSRSRIDRRMQEPSFLQKCENDLTGLFLPLKFVAFASRNRKFLSFFSFSFKISLIRIFWVKMSDSSESWETLKKKI